MKRLRIILWAMVVVAALLFGLFAYQLSQPKDAFVTSAMVGEQVPQFTLEPAAADRPGLAAADLANGRPQLLNLFGSWCVPCRVEAPQLEMLERQGATINGVALRDRPDDVAQFLEIFGNPFARIGRDDVSEMQFALGSSGVPETFVIDGQGRITYQHIGPIMDRDVPTIMEELRKAGAGS
ncbi:redoxin family protein [Erythrobacter arachoides]|uniref:Redoxin family protein n=1 Tax=Aurantiacibacter arachoides TaxID=1850444 RepID=A0A844ZXS1_9SPHN|nr:redoxin family protein [Aurantiacibacter arachoides]MXO92923.1 redoxin family protein [Aurantiacibacter arachoides]GGD53381.1 thiol:disulfide interchange protein [Aurantiacibacter arachoides]